MTTRKRKESSENSSFNHSASALVVKDLYLAATFQLRGYRIKSVRRGDDGLVHFIFESMAEGDDLNRIQEEYYLGNLRVEPKAFASAWKGLRKLLDEV